MLDEFKQYSAIGLLGGTFNPVHNGHIMMAKLAYEQCQDIEKIFFLPNNKPNYKENQGIVSVEHRLNMLRLAVANIDYTEVSSLEIERGGITYTIDTLSQLLNINNYLKIYLIIGADSLFTFDKWFEYKEILKQCNLLIVSRNSGYEQMKLAADILKQKVPEANIRILKGEEYDVSSTYIRENIYLSRDIKDYLPEGVYDYIISNNLYK